MPACIQMFIQWFCPDCNFNMHSGYMLESSIEMFVLHLINFATDNLLVNQLHIFDSECICKSNYKSTNQLTKLNWLIFHTKCKNLTFNDFWPE